MLRSLHIENFAIMDRVEVEFHAGLNVLTGETGAGKSMVVDAISTLLGKRASGLKVRSGAAKAVIEGLFRVDCPGVELSLLMDSIGIELCDGGLILRRDIYASGGGRCFINGMMSTSASLAKIGECLCDIHGQYMHQGLLRPSRQLDLLDEYAGAMDLRDRVGRLYREIKAVERERDGLLRGCEEVSRRVSDLRYAVDDIDKADLKEGEDKDLEKSIGIMQDFERLHRLCGGVLVRLSGEEGSIMAGLKSSVKALEEAGRSDEELLVLAGELEGCCFQIDELSEHLRIYHEKLVHDPSRLEELLERRELVRRMKKKYGSTILEVIEYRRRACEEIEALESDSSMVAELEERLKELKSELLREAGMLTDLRVDRAPALEKEVVNGLRELGMEQAAFSIEISPREHGVVDGLGAERVSFLISTNTGESLKPLSGVVSGGELSRIMLALRALQARNESVPTLIFDEVDSGIGGQTAHAVGRKLHKVSRGRQVFVITHLPQIAARADHHFSVKKFVTGGRASVRIEELRGDSRVGEIVRMMGGNARSMASRRHAGELLGSKRKGS